MPQSEIIAAAPSDTNDSIAAANRLGDPELRSRKYAVMRATPFSFMRGTCQLFYSSLPDVVTFSGAPPAWLCGDMHAENFGTYKGDSRLTYFDVNDFDECALGPLTLDLVRFLASIRVGASEWGISVDDTDTLVQRALLAYCTELSLGKPSWIERENARGAVKRLFAQVAGRSRNELLNRYTVRKGKRRRIAVDGVRLLPVTPSERTGVEQMMTTIADVARDSEYFSVVDVARRISGVGSIAYARFIALVEGRGSPDRNVLMDVKLAHASALGTLRAAGQPVWSDYADRVVSVQRHSAVVAPAFLFPARWNDQSFCSRELQPQEDRVRLQAWEKQPKKIAEAIILMANVAAWLHLRGGGWLGSAPIEQLSAFGRETSWRAQVLLLARGAAERTAQQYHEFCYAYDAGFYKELALPPD
ncbi:MAG: DUF2252 domain-containing protein [Gemmatimonadota bacterium]|nr:DUF2252 domain-containing protein [Gemmatimonadota bacterium]